MALVCSISQETPEVAVVSPVSGHVFERRLVEKYIHENGVDPVNGQPLSVDDLVEIKTAGSVKARPMNTTSIPAILKLLQDEWDAVMLGAFTSRQQLTTARQELSHALYQHDAACRVIARLNKEVTAAREALATLKPHAAAVAPPAEATFESAAADESAVENIVEAVGLTEEIIQKLLDKAATLTAGRKQRGKAVPEGLAKPDDIKEYTQQTALTGLHSTSSPGITALDVRTETEPQLIITGGVDKTVSVLVAAEERQVAVLRGHQKRVTAVAAHPTDALCVSASADATLRVWAAEGGDDWKARHTLRPHDAAVAAVSLHPTGDFVLSVSADEKWAFADIRVGRILCSVADESAGGHALTCAQFHPDGLIFGVGTQDAMVKIWDLKEQTNVANFPGHTGAIRAISFSENGYYLATAAEDAVVKLWDLRKLKNFKTITMDGQALINDLCFDQSGTYLAVAGSDVRVYQCKQWQELCALADHSEAATGVRWGRHAGTLLSAGLDRSLRRYGPSINDDSMEAA